jgi:hypothetical protein
MIIEIEPPSHESKEVEIPPPLPEKVNKTLRRGLGSTASNLRGPVDFPFFLRGVFFFPHVLVSALAPHSQKLVSEKRKPCPDRGYKYNKEAFLLQKKGLFWAGRWTFSALSRGGKKRSPRFLVGDPRQGDLCCTAVSKDCSY